MTVSSVALGDVISGLVDVLRVADGFRAPDESTADVPVFDGAVVSAASNMSCVVVGSDGSDGPQRPGRFQSVWEDQQLSMLEDGSVQCAAVVWSGDSNAFSDQRDTVFGIVADVDTAIRASASAAALGVARLLWCQIVAGELVAAATENGTETRLAFTINYRAFLEVTS